MKILVRLPNWLGDMVMSVAFMDKLHQEFPGAEVSVVAKKGIHTLLDLFPPLVNRYIFSKEEFPGLRGAMKFGRLIRSQENYDLFFCLPDSFSSAVMAYGTGTPVRIGFKKELRSGLLTHSYLKPKGMHRVDEYVQLVSYFTGKSLMADELRLRHSSAKQNYIAVNINSAKQSTRLPAHKGTSVVDCLRKHTDLDIVMAGSKAEAAHVEAAYKNLKSKKGIHLVAGNTSIAELADSLAAARVVLTTDSGPAHLANALGVPTVVLIGPADEHNVSPFNKDNLTVMRLGQLPCEPCLKNTCRLFPEPKCLTLLDELRITNTVLSYV